jgi:hemoglobin
VDKYPLDESGLAQLVEAFYARVRADAALGPVFNGAIAHWPEHLDKLSAFWSSVMLTSGRYKGQPVPAHLRHREAMTPEMFGRWLGLWRDVTGEMMQPEAASALQARAERIAESLQLAVHFRMPPDPVSKPAPNA